MRSYIPPVNSDEELFVKRIQELCSLSIQKGINKSTGFLTDRQQDLALIQLNRLGCDNYAFFGGQFGQDRKVLFLGDSNGALDQIYSVFIKPTIDKTDLTHRDYLGALLAMGIKRECIGDIILNDDGALVYVSKATYNLALNELGFVGKFAVNVTDGANASKDFIKNNYIEKTASISSLRLDNVLCAMCNVSRSAAQEIVRTKLVEINHIPINSVHFDMQKNDVVSIKGKGKYKLCEIGSKSRKNKVFIKYICY